jgi:hypothetical protein
MKQTAVEWLLEQFENHRATFFKLNDKEERVITLAGRNVVEQAKEMEKEQMLKFGIRCQMDFIKSDGIRSVEDIWEETFNTNG